MKYLLVSLLLALSIGAGAALAAEDRHVEVSSEYNGHGVVAGPRIVLTVAHLMCDEDSCRNIASVEGSVATRAAWGKGGYSDDSADDNCDWALLECNAYQSASWLQFAEPAVGDACYFYRGKDKQHIRVSAYVNGVAEFTGARPKKGDSGSGVFRADGTLVGLITTRNNGCSTCTGGTCTPGAMGWFCAISGELAKALEAARDE